jgi:hypothetical protein
MMNKITISALLTLFPLVSFAEPVITYDDPYLTKITDTGVYVLGTNETLDTARKAIIASSKENASELIGSFIDKKTVIKNESITNEYVRFYSFSLSKLDEYTAKKSINENNQIEISYTVKLLFDKGSIEKGIESINGNLELERKIDRLKNEHELILSQLFSNQNSYINNKDVGIYDTSSLFFNLDKNSDSLVDIMLGDSIYNQVKVSKINYEKAKKVVDDAYSDAVDSMKIKINSVQISTENSKTNLYINVDWDANPKLLLSPVEPFFYIDQYKNLKGYSVLCRDKNSIPKVSFSCDLHKYFHDTDIVLLTKIGNRVDKSYISPFYQGYGNVTIKVKGLPYYSGQDSIEIKAGLNHRL